MLYKSDRSVHLYYEKDKNFAQNKFDWWKLKFKYIALHPGKKNVLSLEKSNLVLLIILFTPRPYLFNVRNETIFNGGRIHPKPCRIYYRELRRPGRESRFQTFAIRSTMATDVEKSKELAQDRTGGGGGEGRRGIGRGGEGEEAS